MTRRYRIWEHSEKNGKIALHNFRCFYFILFVIVSCRHKTETHPPAFAYTGTTNSGTAEAISAPPEINPRLTHIRYLYGIYPEIHLPFLHHIQGSEAITTFDAKHGLDTLIFAQDVPCAIIGVIPDTSNYYGFFYLIAADAPIPTLITYDKKGNLINKSMLAVSCWQGCESDCRSVIKIDKQLKIEFRYEEFEFDFDHDKNWCGASPITASGFVKQSYVDPSGTVIETKSVPLSSEELMKNPIVR